MSNTINSVITELEHLQHQLTVACGGVNNSSGSCKFWTDEIKKNIGGVNCDDDLSDVWNHMGTFLKDVLRPQIDEAVAELKHAKHMMADARATSREAIEENDRLERELFALEDRLSRANDKLASSKNSRKWLVNAEADVIEKEEEVHRFGNKLIFIGKVIEQHTESLNLILTKYLGQPTDGSLLSDDDSDDVLGDVAAGDADGLSPYGMALQRRSVVSPSELKLTAAEIQDDLRHSLGELTDALESSVATSLAANAGGLPPLKKTLSRWERRMADSMGLLTSTRDEKKLLDDTIDSVNTEQPEEDTWSGPLRRLSTAPSLSLFSVPGRRLSSGELSSSVMDDESFDGPSLSRSQTIEVALIDRLSQQNSRLLDQIKDETSHRTMSTNFWRKSFERIQEMKETIDKAHQRLEQETVATQAAENRVRSLIAKIQKRDEAICDLEVNCREQSFLVKELEDKLKELEVENAQLKSHQKAEISAKKTDGTVVKSTTAQRREVPSSSTQVKRESHGVSAKRSQGGDTKTRTSANRTHAPARSTKPGGAGASRAKAAL